MWLLYDFNDEVYEKRFALLIDWSFLHFSQRTWSTSIRFFRSFVLFILFHCTIYKFKRRKRSCAWLSTIQKSLILFTMIGDKVLVYFSRCTRLEYKVPQGSMLTTADSLQDECLFLTMNCLRFRYFLFNETWNFSLHCLFSFIHLQIAHRIVSCHC